MRGIEPRFVSRLFLLLLLLAGSGARSWAQSLNVSLDGNELAIRVPDLRFVEGESLRRLQDGASVIYVFRLIASNRRGGPSLETTEARFRVSFDLWEERFAVARAGTDPAAISHLTAREAEAWCLESLMLSSQPLAQGPFWIRLEYRVEVPDADRDGGGDSLFTLGGLIDILSRRGSEEQPAGSVEAGPFRLSELR